MGWNPATNTSWSPWSSSSSPVLCHCQKLCCKKGADPAMFTPSPGHCMRLSQTCGEMRPELDTPDGICYLAYASRAHVVSVISHSADWWRLALGKHLALFLSAHTHFKYFPCLIAATHTAWVVVVI